MRGARQQTERPQDHEIGRASWRERGEISVGAVSLKKKKRKFGGTSRKQRKTRKHLRPTMQALRSTTDHISTWGKPTRIRARHKRAPLTAVTQRVLCHR